MPSSQNVSFCAVGVVRDEVFEIYGYLYVLVSALFNIARLGKADERYRRLFDAVIYIVLGIGRLHVYLHYVFAAPVARVGDGERNGHIAVRVGSVTLKSDQSKVV